MSREARSVCQRANLRCSGTIADRNCHGQAFFKRAIATPNVMQVREGDWICSAGTMIYNGRLGQQALRECYDDFAMGGIVQIQARAIGHYTVAIRYRNEVTIFTDPLGSLNLYYIYNGSFWFVSNSLYVCASVLPHRRIDSTKLLITTVQGALPGEDTFYLDIKRLFGTQLIRIDLAACAFRVEGIPKSMSAVSWNLPSIQDAVDQYKQELRSVFREVSAVGPIGLLGTGGKDSRTILAGLLEWQAPLQILYGIGNSRLTDYDIRDLNVAKAVADLCKVPFQQLDWSGNQPHSESTLRELFQTYGFKYEIYGAPDSLLRAFNGGISPYPRLFLGGYGPATTNSKPWQLKQTSFSFEDLISSSMSYQGGTVEGTGCIIDKKTYRSVFAGEIKAGLRCGGIDFPDAHASLETFVKAKLFLYIRPDARFLNFANEFAHYIAPFAMKRLGDPLQNIPSTYRVNDEFQIRLIHALAPNLVTMPLYSGWAPARIDGKTFQLISAPNQNRKQMALLRMAKVILPAAWVTSVRNLVRPISQENGAAGGQLTDRDVAIVNAYGQQVLNDPLGRRWFSSTSEFTPKMLSRIYQYLTGVNTLGYSE